MVVEEYKNEKYRAQILLINYVHKVIFYENNNLVKIEEYRGKTLEEVKNICREYIEQK